MLPQPVADYLQAHRDEHLERLFEYLRFASIANLSPDPDPCRQCAEWLADHAARLGFEAEIIDTDGKPNVVASARAAGDGPTVLIYGHYDVQPPEPLEAWDSDPFEPIVRAGRIVARGASDDKGQFFAQLMAMEAWQRAAGGLPVHVKLFVEGEEEIGSPGAEPFVTACADRLAADVVVMCDGQFFAAETPSITYALRGLAYVEVTVTGPSADIHSGLHGGLVLNPVNVLATLIAAMHDETGRVTIPGFYDDVRPVSDAELAAWELLPFDEAAHAAAVGVEALTGGERGTGALQRRWARPTLDCNGIVGGFTGAGSKTIIPARADAKISMRLVADQDPAKIIAGVEQFVADRTPRGVRSSVAVHASARPAVFRTDSPAMTAARDALAEAFGREAALIRCGASLPIAETLQRVLGVDPVLMGVGLPDDNVHAPNETFSLEQLRRASVAGAALLQNLRDAGIRPR